MVGGGGGGRGKGVYGLWVLRFAFGPRWRVLETSCSGVLSRCLSRADLNRTANLVLRQLKWRFCEGQASSNIVVRSTAQRRKRSI